MQLSVDSLSIGRGGLSLLAGLSFAVAPGECLVLRGPNGVGKTSLLRTLAGLQPPRAGRIDLPAEAAVYASHLDGLKPTLSVAENLSFWARIYGQDRGAVRGALEVFGLGGLAGRAAQNLSAGQRRRAGLARLLVSGRPVWLLDEPTVSLDAAAVTGFATCLARHLKAGGLAVVATHLDIPAIPARALDLTAFRTGERDRAPGPFDEVLP